MIIGERDDTGGHHSRYCEGNCSRALCSSTHVRANVTAARFATMSQHQIEAKAAPNATIRSRRRFGMQRQNGRYPGQCSK